MAVHNTKQLRVLLASILCVGVVSLASLASGKGSGWNGYTLASGASLDNDNLADIVGRENATGKLYFYKSTGSGNFAAKVQIGVGW